MLLLKKIGYEKKNITKNKLTKHLYSGQTNL